MQFSGVWRMKVNQRTSLIRRIRNLLPLQATVSTLCNTLILLFLFMETLCGKTKTVKHWCQDYRSYKTKLLKSRWDTRLSRSSSREANKILYLKPLSTRKVFHGCTLIHKCLLREIDFNFSFISPFSQYKAFHSPFLGLSLSRNATLSEREGPLSVTQCYVLWGRSVAWQREGQNWIRSSNDLRSLVGRYKKAVSIRSN